MTSFSYEHSVPQCPFPSSYTKNYKSCDKFEEPVYNPDIHLDLKLPEYIVNLKFEKFFLKEIDLNIESDNEKVKDFLKPGLAFTSPFKVLSSEGLKVLRGIIDYHLTNTPHLSKHTNRQAWCMRALAYVSKFVRDFSQCEVRTKRYSWLAGKLLNPHSMPLNWGHVNVGVAGTGQKVDQWHVDSVTYVLVLMVSDPIGVVGGELQVLKKDRCGTDMKAILNILNSQTDAYTPEDILTVNYGEAGAGIFMQGSHIFHQVTQVIKSDHGPRISFVDSYMPANVFDEDWTKFSTFRDGDPRELVYLEYARLVTWKAQGMLDFVTNKVRFDDEEGRAKANDIIKKVLKELEHGYLLLTDQSDDLIGYHDSKEKSIKDYEDIKHDRKD
jgi:hypothetical protein